MPFVIERGRNFQQSLCIAALAAQPAMSCAIAGCFSMRWALTGAAAIICGMMLISWTCGRIPAAALLMLAACAAGMAAGGAVDSLSQAIGGLAGLCTSTSVGFGAVVFHHVTAMPAMHGLMLVGGAVAMALIEWQAGSRPIKTERWRGGRLAFGAACNVAMLAGMTAGGRLGPLLADRFSGSSAMLALMGAGMVWGMVAMMMICHAGSTAYARERAFFNRTAGAPDLARP